jgi:hypothetical protein
MSRKLVVFMGTVAVCSALLWQPALAPPLHAQGQITDTAEYNAYVACINEPDNAKKAACVDGFLAKYPKTVVKETALDLKLTAQQQSNQPFVQTAADILAVNPNNTKALLVMSFVFNNTQLAESDPQFQQKLSDEESIAKRGIDQLSSMKKPENVSDADWAKSKNVTAAVQYKGLGLVALYRKDNRAAIDSFKKAAEMTPDDGTLFYQIASAYGKLAAAAAGDEKIADESLAIWYYARTIGVEGLNADGKKQVDAYLLNFYKRYHGSDEGLAELKAKTASTPFPPSDFHVKTKVEMTPPPPPPPPPPPIPDDISTWPFSLIQETLIGGGDRASQVLTKLKAAGFGSEGVIVSAVPPLAAKTVKIAVLKKTQETADAFDVVVTLTAPTRALTKGKKVEFEGTVKDFADGALVMTAGKVTAKAVAAHKPAGKKK